MAIASTNTDAPMMEMNTTPLIDVMLVLLIMFIITIPVAVHSTDWNLGGTSSTRLIDPVTNRVEVTTDGRLLWNGDVVTRPELASLLDASRRLPVEPELQFQPEANASYDLAAKVTHLIKASGVTKFGFVGNEMYSEFDKPAGTE